MAYEKKCSLPDTLSLMISWIIMAVVLMPASGAHGHTSKDDTIIKETVSFAKTNCVSPDVYIYRPLKVTNNKALLFYYRENGTNSLFRYDATTNATDKLFDLNRDRLTFFSSRNRETDSLGYVTRVDRSRRYPYFFAKAEISGWDIGVIGTDAVYQLPADYWRVNDHSDLNDKMLAISMSNMRSTTVFVFHKEKKKWLSTQIDKPRVAIVHGSMNENGIDLVALFKSSNRMGQYYHWDFESTLRAPDLIGDWFANYPISILSSMSYDQPYYLLKIDDNSHLAFRLGSYKKIMKIEKIDYQAYQTTASVEFGTGSHAQIIKMPNGQILVHRGMREEFGIYELDPHSLEIHLVLEKKHLPAKLRADRNHTKFIGGDKGQTYLYINANDQDCLINMQ